MIFKRIAYIILLLAAVIVVCYFLQPSKTGQGQDKSIVYKQEKYWPQLPSNFKLGNPTGLGIDTNQNIFVFHRADRTWPLLGAMPTTAISSNTILMLDRQSGKILNSWGSNLFIMPHGLTIDQQNNVWVTDVGLHQIFKFSHEGKLLLCLGIANTPGNDSLHFDQPTDIAVTINGSFYVSDGYGNSRIIKFSAEGKYLFQWGRKGANKGEFNIPHSIDIDKNGYVYVADRENERIQIFDSSGTFLKQVTDKSFASICAVSFDPQKQKFIAVDDHSFFKIKHKGSDLFVFDSAGNVQSRFGRSGSYDGNICWYHDAVMDKDGNVYIGDLLGNTIQKFKPNQIIQNNKTGD